MLHSTLRIKDKMEVKSTKIKFSKNFLNINFQKVLLPTRITQHVVFLSKFCIKSNCIMPNGILYNIISLIGMLFFIFLYLSDGHVKGIGQTCAISYLLCFNFTTTYTVSITGYILFYFNNVFTSKKHVKMIVTIQKSFRNIHFSKYKYIIAENWSHILGHYVPYLLFIFVRLDTYVIMFFFSMVYFDVYVSYSVCLSKLLHGGLLTWISEIQYHTQVTLSVSHGKEKMWTKLFEVYTDLMEAFSIFKDVFQVPVILIFKLIL